MKLLTAAIEKAFEKNPLGSHDGEWTDAKVIVKFFNPYGVGTWLITEAEKQEDGDWLMFGWVDLGYGFEAGYISFNELNNIRVNVFGCRLPLERDRYEGIGKRSVKEYIEE